MNDGRVELDPQWETAKQGKRRGAACTPCCFLTAETGVCLICAGAMNVAMTVAEAGRINEAVAAATEAEAGAEEGMPSSSSSSSTEQYHEVMVWGGK